MKMINNRYEIGGDKWLSKKKIDTVQSSNSFKPITFHSKNELHLSNCRSALRLIAEEISKHYTSSTILIPGFTCDTVFNPFLEYGFTVILYNIKSDFSVDWKDVKNKVKKYQPRVFLFHSYFGYPTVQYDLSEVLDAGVIVIEDYTQNLLSNFKRLASNYQVGSIRKWFSIPDGGFLFGLSYNRSLVEDVDLVSQKIEAFDLKYRYLNGEAVDKGFFLEKLEHAKHTMALHKTIFKMSIISERLAADAPIQIFKEQRRKNYIRLLAHLAKYPTITIPLGYPSEGIVPFMFPIFIKDRNGFQNYLAKHNVYATKLWNLPIDLRTFLSEETVDIYEHLLCFPIDEYYSEQDMDYIGKIVDQYFLD